MFQKSYKDLLKELEKKNAKEESKQKVSALEDIQLFPSYVFDISNTYSELIDCRYWYKKAFVKKHIYSIDVYNNESNKENKQENCYKELLGVNGWMAAIYNLPVVTDDYMTGYYFTKLFIAPVKNNAIIQSLHFGTNRQFLSGMEKCLGKKVSKWKWYGTDVYPINEYKKQYINGIDKIGDVNNINTIKSIRNQLSNILVHKLSFFIQDIYPTNLVTLLNSILVPLTDVDESGFSIIRLPDPHTWDTSFDGTHILNFLLLCVTQYDLVKIFKTPWGFKAKYYIILAKPKEKLSMQKLTTLIKYIEDVTKTPNINLFHQIIFDEISLDSMTSKTTSNTIGNTKTDDKTTDTTSNTNDKTDDKTDKTTYNNMESFITSMLLLQDKLINYYDVIPNDKANEIWLEQIMGYDKKLEKKPKKNQILNTDISSPRSIRK